MAEKNQVNSVIMSENIVNECCYGEFQYYYDLWDNERNVSAKKTAFRTTAERCKHVTNPQHEWNDRRPGRGR